MHSGFAMTGIVLNTAHFYPNDPNSQADIAAAQRGYGECICADYINHVYLPRTCQIFLVLLLPPLCARNPLNHFTFVAVWSLLPHLIRYN